MDMGYYSYFNRNAFFVHAYLYGRRVPEDRESA